jgi:hypothetical protein
MPSTHDNLAILGFCRIIIALWELVVTKAQPFSVHELLLPPEADADCESNRREIRRLKRWEKRHGHQGSEKRNRLRKNPPYNKMAGRASRPKTTRVYDLFLRMGYPAQDGAGYLIPQHLSPELRRAILMLNKCDSSNFVMKSLLTRLLQTIDRDIRVDWYVVVPAPRFEIRVAAMPLPDLHSVLLITTPSGAQTILDLTGEQFGFDPKDQICSLHDYLRNNVVKPGEWSAARYTSDTEVHEQTVEWALQGNHFCQAARREVESLFWDWIAEVSDGRLGGDQASCEQWMKSTLASKLNSISETSL